MTIPDDRGPARRLPGIAWLTLVWVLLWGSFSPLSVLGGLLVGLLVTAMFRMPLVPQRLPLRPLRLLGLAAYLGYDLLWSGAEVSWQVLRRGPDARGAILAVPLISGSDRVVTVVANALSLSPGTMALQIDHDHDVWYVYALGPRDRAGVERARRQIMDLQRRVLEALGTPDEIARARRALVTGGKVER